MKNFLFVLIPCVLVIVLLSLANRKVQETLPTVLYIVELQKTKENIPSGKQRFHLQFSEPMDTKFSGFDYGPQGEKTALFVDQFRFSDEQMGVIEVNLEPNRFYQLEVSTNFRNKEGVRINPYLIEFRTGLK